MFGALGVGVWGLGPQVEGAKRKSSRWRVSVSRSRVWGVGFQVWGFGGVWRGQYGNKVTSGNASYISIGTSKTMYGARPKCT